MLDENTSIAIVQRTEEILALQIYCRPNPLPAHGNLAHSDAMSWMCLPPNTRPSCTTKAACSSATISRQGVRTPYEALAQ